MTQEGFIFFITIVFFLTLAVFIGGGLAAAWSLYGAVMCMASSWLSEKFKES